MKIKLNTVEDIKTFVDICSKYCDSNIEARQDRHIVDGKSILGMFSLNLLEPVKVIIDSENDNDKMAFYNAIQQWKYK